MDELTIQSEQIDNIPLLMGQQGRMGIGRVLNANIKGKRVLAFQRLSQPAIRPLRIYHFVVGRSTMFDSLLSTC